MATDNKDVIPAGSPVPEKSGEADVSAAQDTPAPVEDPKLQDKPNDEMTSLKEQLANAEKLIGRQGKELGELRNEYKALSESAQKAADASNDPGYDTRLAEIQSQVDNGDIDFGQALSLTAQLSAEMGAAQAANEFKGQMQRTKEQEVQAKFLQDNPDFTELDQSGALDEIMAGNPMHDKFSAYFELKAKQTETKMAEAIEAARKEGEQQGAKEREAAGKAEGVLGKKGSGVRDKTQRTSYKNAAERKQAMIEALIGARS